MEDAKISGNLVFKDLKYTVFALGSSLYEHFCNFGIFCDEMIEYLGGHRIAPMVLSDAEIEQDEPFKNWTKRAMVGASRAMKVDIPVQIQQNWPFSSINLIRKARFVSTNYKVSDNISGNNIKLYSPV